MSPTLATHLRKKVSAPLIIRHDLGHFLLVLLLRFHYPLPEPNQTLNDNKGTLLYMYFEIVKPFLI